MIYIRSFIFNVLFYGTLGVGCVIGSIIGLCNRKATIPFWNKLWMPLCNSYLKICGIKIEIRGLENIKQEGVIYAVKHQSAAETYFLSSYLTKATFILKKELTYIPIFGWAQHFYGMIPIDRSAGGATLKKMLKASQQKLKEKRPIVIFPEGTRTKPGLSTEYKPGLVFLYQKLNVPVIPVALNTGLFWAKNSFLRHPGKIVVEFMPEIKVGLEKKVFMQELKNQIENKCAEINQESMRDYPATKKMIASK